MSADNLIARREARRKKILENSENRLKRITGRNDSSEKTDIIKPEENGLVTISNEKLTNGFVETENGNDISPCPPLRGCPEESLVDPSISEQFDFLSSTSANIDSDGVLPLKGVASYVPSNVIYISIAILFRLSIELDSHFVCANSLVVAFLLTKVAVSSLYGLPILETSRFLGSLLLLSGISIQKIKIFTLSMNILYSGLHEFALCIFVFVFCDLFINTFKSLSH